MQQEFCPDCIEGMVINRKKLGEFTVWIVCPKCGYRKRVKSSYEVDKENEKFKEYKYRVNSNNREEE